MAKYNVWNATDGVFVNYRPLSSKGADILIETFPERFYNQGFYFTADGKRIPIEDVVLEKKKCASTLNNIISSLIKGG